MSTVVMHNVVSVDGYIADDNDDVGPLFEWYLTVTIRSHRARWTSRRRAG